MCVCVCVCMSVCVCVCVCVCMCMLNDVNGLYIPTGDATILVATATATSKQQPRQLRRGMCR